MTSLIRQTYPLANLVDRFFDDSFYSPAMGGSRQADDNGRAWMPSVDLSQTENGYTVKADLPGMTKKDISLTVENNTLTLAGERSFEKKHESETYNRIERSFGRFSRSFGLPSNVDPTGVTANFKDGVLIVEIPKLEEAKSRQIEIS
jgi:HSP20 family protein